MIALTGLQGLLATLVHYLRDWLSLRRSNGSKSIDIIIIDICKGNLPTFSEIRFLPFADTFLPTAGDFSKHEQVLSLPQYFQKSSAADAADASVNRKVLVLMFLNIRKNKHM